MKTPILALLLALVACNDKPSVHVIDGDTLTLGRERVRLSGIDAPEVTQFCGDASGKSYDCGVKAREHLQMLVAYGRVSCQPRYYRDVYRRSVASCSVTTGPVAIDINEQMVLAGWAIDWPKYSGGRYAWAEQQARAAKRGMWAGKFTLPSDWRKARR